MIWNTIANARRMMAKDPQILQEAKELCMIREKRTEEAYQRQKKRKIEAPAGESTDSAGVKAQPDTGVSVGEEPDLSRPQGGGF